MYKKALNTGFRNKHHIFDLSNGYIDLSTLCNILVVKKYNDQNLNNWMKSSPSERSETLQ
jgi:hypothetical protein